MPSPRTPTKNSSWSRSLRDSDDDSCDDAAPPPRSSRQKRTRTTSSDADGFTWGAGSDAVDIGLVSEPAGLKFVETPFTLAKRTGARGNCGGGTDGKGRLAFAPAESLAAFRARMAGASAASSSSSSTGAAAPASGGRKRARDAASAEDGSGRERLVLGTAVRSVRPVSLASTGASGRARGGGMGRSVGARAAPRLERAQDGAECAEARLRRLYRSLEG
ncbi:hypothetical protein JCM10449v2_006860 [Rhodotorula kratochvilovae]